MNITTTDRPGCQAGLARTRRHDAGVVRFTARNAAGLVLAGDMYGAPYDLPAVRAAGMRAAARCTPGSAAGAHRYTT